MFGPMKSSMPLIEKMEAEEKLIQFDESNKKDMLNKRYWVVATLWEAAVGAGNEVSALNWENEAKSMPVAAWMQETLENQGAKLKSLLATYTELV